MLATACVSGDPEAEGPGSTDISGSDIALTSGPLSTFDNCDALLGQLVDAGTERVGPHGFGQGGYWGGPAALEAEEAMEDDEASFDADAASDSFATSGDDSDAAESGGGDDFSRTNNQEIDVDEPDLVKTDGERLVTVTGQELRIIGLSDDGPTLDNSIALPGDVWAGELFLDGDTALVMSNGWTDSPLAESDGLSDYSYPGGMPITRIVEINLAEGEIVRSLEFEGNYLSARDVDGTARIVLSATQERFPFVFPSNPAAEDAAEAANRSIIENSTIEQWLPSYRLLDSNDDVLESGQIVECDRMHIPGEFGGFGTLALLTIDLDEGLSLTDSLAVLTDGQTIYASTDRLAVATTKWPEWDPETGDAIEGSDEYVTQIHTFDISDPATATYKATGSVRGHLLNQFSMSEFDGFLRVATTDGSPWGDTSNSESFVTVLSENNETLETVGQVGGLGEGEQIFAVRFIGTTAYVVTFRQVDPLYTVDLSEPTEPTVLGELKIPGFSTYLHPIDEGLILGIGQDATDEGATTGAQVSAFNVSDLTNPTRDHQLSLGENTYSPIDWDKKAFTYWAETRTAYVPISWWNWDEETGSEDNGASVVAVRVGEDGTLTEIGQVTHPAFRGCEGPDGYTEELVFDVDGPEPAANNNEEEEVVNDAPDAIDEAPEEISEEPVVEEEAAEADAVAETVEDEPAVEEEAFDAEASFAEPEEAPAPVPAPEDSDDVSRDDVEYCWSYASEIQRTVVVGDQLLTLSHDGVLASNLDDLSTIGWLSFNN